MMKKDVPSPIDLRTMKDAREWERTANEKRPSRPEFFETFVKEIQTHRPKVNHVLELGSGPGFLANHILDRLQHISYVALDFSGAMHELAGHRLGEKVSRVRFVERSFKELDWRSDLGAFECVVTNQAVHELRHKRYAQALHEQVRDVLSAGGLYLVCDHFAGDGGMSNSELYMTKEEQQTALTGAGFTNVDLVMCDSSLIMYRAQ